MSHRLDYAPLESLDITEKSSGISAPEIGSAQDCSSYSSESSTTSSSECWTRSSTLSQTGVSEDCHSEGLESLHYRSENSSSSSSAVDCRTCLVLILSCFRPHHQHIENLKSIFSASCFQTEHFDAHHNSDASCNAKHLLALSYARSRYPNQPVLIIEDTSVSILDADLMASRIKGVMAHYKKFDLFYLCKWNDQCQYYQKISDTSHSDCLYYTKSPHGLQAILFTPHGRDIILGARPMRNKMNFKEQGNLDSSLVEAISEGHIIATTCLTNWVNYDLTLAEDRQQFARANQCSINRSPNNNGDQTWDIAAWIWLVIIIILVILIAWAIIRMAP